MMHSERAGSRWHGAASLLALLLAGCGGGGDGDKGGKGGPAAVGGPSVEQILVLDGYSVARPNGRTLLDLSPFVRGNGMQVTQLSSPQGECGGRVIDGVQVEVDITDATLCQYSFAVRSGGGAQGQASLSVLATNAEAPLLEPLSQTLVVGAGVTRFDLEAIYKLNGKWPDGYRLRDKSAEVRGGQVQGKVTQQGNVLSYTPPTSADWNRIIFVLENPNKPGQEVLGSLYVTVSAAANRPVTITPEKFDIPVVTGAGRITPVAATIIDLTQLAGLTITHPDGGEWQLIEVQSFTATVSSANATDVTNKKFRFQAPVGDHVVNYIVGDRNGGFRMGMLKLTVSPQEKVADWREVFHGNRLYKAPLRYSDMQAAIGGQLRGSLDAVLDSQVNNAEGNTIGAVGHVAALAACSGSRVPRKAELDALRSSTGSAATEWRKWPRQRAYLTTEDSQTFATYNLDNGTVGTYNPNGVERYYVTCVQDYATKYVPLPSPQLVGRPNTIIADNEWRAIGTVTSEGGALAPEVNSSATTNLGSIHLAEPHFRLVPAGCPTGVCQLEVRGAVALGQGPHGSDAYAAGTATIKIRNKMRNNVSQDIGPITILQNARIASWRIVRDNSPQGGENLIELNLVDKDNAVLPKQNVLLRYQVAHSARGAQEAVPTVIPGLTATAMADNGQVTMKLKRLGTGTMTVREPVLEGGLPTPKFVTDQPLEATWVANRIAAGGLEFFLPSKVLSTLSEARAACSQIAPTGSWHVAQVADLDTLYQRYPNNTVGLQLFWPTDARYVTSTQVNGSTDRYVHVNLANNVPAEQSQQEKGYVMCVLPQAAPWVPPGQTGGGSGGTVAPPVTPAELGRGPLVVTDGMVVARPDGLTTIDLAPFVRGEGATLVSVTGDQSGCKSRILGDDRRVEFDIKGVLRCVFIVESKGVGITNAVSKLTVLASMAGTPVMPSLNQQLTTASGLTEFDLEALHGANWPAGYRLKDRSATVQGGKVQGQVTQQNNVLSYTPPTTQDWNRIDYILENRSKPGEEKIGVLYVAIQLAGGPSVKLSPVRLVVPGVGQGSLMIVAGERVLVNTIAHLSGLLSVAFTSGYRDIVAAESQTARVTNVGGDGFAFQAATPGEHEVSYVMSASSGGIATGTLVFTVMPASRDEDWQDIRHNQLVFKAPPLFGALLERVFGPGSAVESVQDSVVNGGQGNYVGATNHAGAIMACGTRRLPRKAELEALWSSTDSAVQEQLAKYPKARTYLVTEDNVNFESYDLRGGGIRPYNPRATPRYYVLCVGEPGIHYIAKNPHPALGALPNAAIADNGWYDLGRVEVDGVGETLQMLPKSISYAEGGNGYVELVPANCSGGVCILRARGVRWLGSDSVGEYEDAFIGVARVRLQSNTPTTVARDVDITMLNNLRVASWRVTRNNARVGGQGAQGNEIAVRLEDKTGGLLRRGASVSYTEFIAGVPNVIRTASRMPDANGEVRLVIPALTAGTITVSAPRVQMGLPNAATLPDLTLTVLRPRVIVGALEYERFADRALSSADATRYCNEAPPVGSWRLPTTSELRALYAQYPGNRVNSELGWPTGTTYRSSGAIDSGGRVPTVELSDGQGWSSVALSLLESLCVRPAP